MAIVLEQEHLSTFVVELRLLWPHSLAVRCTRETMGRRILYTVKVRFIHRYVVDLQFGQEPPGGKSIFLARDRIRRG